MLLFQPPYVMNTWKIAGDNNSPIFVDCVVSYDVSFITLACFVYRLICKILSLQSSYENVLLQSKHNFRYSYAYYQKFYFLKNHIKKPKTTKHTHEVLIKEGGSVLQKTIELVMKQSAVVSCLPDDGYSTSSPSMVCVEC